MKTEHRQPEPRPHLTRRFGLLGATALNMSNMIGIGPFITIRLLLSAMGGPQAMLDSCMRLAAARWDVQVNASAGHDP